LLDRVTGAKESVIQTSQITTLVSEIMNTYINAAILSHTLASDHTLYTLDVTRNVLKYNSVRLAKVPGQEVYVYNGVDPLVIAESIPNNTPFTLLITQADLIVQ
jgi:hypothetical protein